MLLGSPSTSPLERTLENVMGVWWFAVGAGVGLAIGEANHRVAMGLALGIALGAVIDVLVRRRRRQ